jgi:4-amino-4-deoxy-L-arabinose transferase-like glycosyltransferase
MAVWPAIVVVFFSLPSSKLVGYILPALAPLAYLVADAGWRWRAARPGATSYRWWLATAGVAAIACDAFTAAAHYLQPKSRQALAETLRVLKRPAERVFFLDNFYYDVMFHARLDAPVSVVDAWLPAEIAKDSWRRELSDAQRLAPAGSPQRLLQAAALAPTLCRAGSSWIIGPWPVGSERRWLATLQPAYQSVNTALWHVDAAEPTVRTALDCGSSSE